MPQDRQRVFTAEDLRPRAFSPLVAPPSAEEDRPNLGETVGAAFRLENVVGSLLSEERRDLTRTITDPDYDALNDIQGYEAFANRFIYSTSAEETARIRRQIDRELADRDIIERAGAGGTVASIAAGVLDPVNLIPVGGTAYRTATTGEAVLQGVGRSALAGGASEAAAQAILLGSQETRTPEEAAFNITGSTLLAGALGGGVAYLGRRGTAPIEQVTDEVDALLRGEVVSQGSLSAGATTRPAADLASEGSLGLEDLTRMNPVTTNPLMQGLASPSEVVRNVTADIADTPQFLRGNARGEASPISAETIARLWDGPLADSIRETEDLYVRYRTGRARRPGDRARLGGRDLLGQRPEGMLSYPEFREAVAQAMRRGDAHEIAEVAEAARGFRRRLFDPLKQEAIDLGLLPADVNVSTAQSYLTRMFDVDQIVARRNEFVRDVLVPYLGESAQRASRAYEEAQAALKKARATIEADEPTIQPLRQGLRDSERELRRTRARRDAVGRSLSQRQAALSRIETALAHAERRAADMTPTTKLGRDDPFAVQLRDARSGVPKPKVGPSLAEFIARGGGIRDDGGDLLAMGADAWHRDRPGRPRLVRQGADGEARYGADRWRELAVEAGYLPDGADIDDLLEAIRREVSGRPVYRPDDESALAIWHERSMAAEDFAAYLDETGVPWRTMRDEHVAVQIADYGGDAGRFVSDTPFSRARKREAEFSRRRLTRLRDAEREATGKQSAERDMLALESRGLADRVSEARMALDGASRRLDSARSAEARAAAEVELNARLARAGDAELIDMAEEIANTIVSRESGGMFGVSNARGPLMERTLHIPDEALEARAFLINDIDRVSRYYARQMGGQTALAEKFGRVDMRDQIQAIRDDYSARMRKTPDGREQRRLQDLMERDIRNVEAMRDRILGTYGAPSNPSGLMVRTGRFLRNLNYVRLMGGATLSSIVDVGNVVAAHGWARLFGQGLPAFLSNTRRVRLAKRELELAGAAVETVLNGRAMQLADAMDDFGRYSKFERGLQWMGDQFGKANLLSAWTDAMKKVDGLIASTRMMQAIDALEAGRRGAETGSHVAAKETRRLRQLGIDAEMQRRIAGQFRKHGDRDGGVWLSGVEDWTDREAARAWMAALRKDIDQTIVTPGMERPLWMSQEWGKLVGQFKSFGLSATLRLTTRALQQRDLNALQGVITLMMLGGMTVWIKSTLAGREPPDDPVEWALASAEQSGMIGWIMDANNMAERVGVPGIYRLSGSRPSQRYAARNVAETIGGPSVGLAQDAVQIAGALASPEDDFGRDDIRRARLLVPFQNLFYLRWLFDQAEDKTGDVLGEPEPPAP